MVSKFEIINRFLKKPKGSFFLLGPRGTGKSTWLQQHFPEAKRFDLLDEALYQRFLADPGGFGGELRRLTRGATVIVDEVQRLPSLLNEVHRFIEDRGMVFALCGSSARKLKRAGVNLLAGRAVHRAMHPFLPGEIGKDFDLERALQQGLLPLVWASEDPAESLAAYARMYLREEIQAEALVRNLPGFARFLPVAAVCHGQATNISNLARDAAVARTTVAGYLQILEETLLAFHLPAYEAKLRVRERAHPKFYFCDPGLVWALKSGQLAAAPEETGALFEGLVAQVLRAYRDYTGHIERLCYWSSGAGVEVDFLLGHKNQWVAVEVKTGTRPRSDWFRGLNAVKDLPGMGRRIIVRPHGPSETASSGVEILSLVALEQELASGTLWNQSGP